MQCSSGTTNRDNAIRHRTCDILTDNHAIADAIREACWRREWVCESAALDTHRPTVISPRQQALVCGRAQNPARMSASLSQSWLGARALGWRGCARIILLSPLMFLAIRATINE